MAFQIMALLVSETDHRYHESCFGQCRRYLWTLAVYRRHAWRCGGNRGASLVPAYTATPGAYALVGMGAAFGVWCALQ